MSWYSMDSEEIKKKLSEYNLTTREYELCLKDIDDKLNGENDLDWNEIGIKYNLPFAPDTIRKASSTILGGAFSRAYLLSKGNDTKCDYDLEKIRKEKQKLSDERAALNKKLREKARYEEDMATLERLIKESGPCDVVNKNLVPSYTSETDIIICLSDFHMGLTAKNYFGEYNSDIAEQRLTEYLKNIINIKALNFSENAYVFILGDIINGEIHYTTQLENRENLVEQIQKSAELLSTFIYGLCNAFQNVYVNSIGGNHSRTTLKELSLRDNRLDDIVIWYIKAKLSGVRNLIFNEWNNIDPTIGRVVIRGHDYFLVHGDWDDFSANGISKLILMTGIKPTAIFYGHLHKCSYDDVSDVKLIRSGAFTGTVDDYCISKRIYGKPSQMVCVVDENGIKALYPVGLE